mgnify:CR=1 FL=1
MKDFLSRHPEWRKYSDLIAVPPTADEVTDEFPDAAGCSLLNDDLTLASDGSTRLAFYMRLRYEGKDHRMADMLASQRPPGCVTDDTFFGGIPRLAEQIGDDKQLQKYVNAARKHGYNPSPNDMYQPGLARFPGDPEAFINRSRGRSYIKKLCERRGWGCAGAVNVEARQPDHDPHDPKHCEPLANDIINNFAKDMVKTNPDLKRKSRAEIRQMVLERHGPTP